jgi:hypothetical protein
VIKTLINLFELKKLILLFLFICIFITNVRAQNIWENPNSQVYGYLNRMAQKGFIQLNDLIKPINRVDIQFALNELTSKSEQLSPIEKLELNFYLQEYKPLNSKDSTIQIIKKDKNNRWRFFNIVNSNFELHADPLIGINRISTDNKNTNQLSSGFEIWGSIGKNKNWGYQVYYRDFTETGNIISNNLNESPIPGRILVGAQNTTSINYSDIRASLNYRFKNGNISVGKDNIIWGYGENGNIVLSNKVPSYPYIRLDYNPIKWLSFNYTHAWLNSNITDSSLSYLNNSGRLDNDIRILFVQKFMATHSIQITPMKGLSLAIGESIIYSDKMDPGFLIPVNLFKFYDNNRSNYMIEAGSNGQYFFSINSRNQLKNTHLYGTLFIDEIKVSALFNQKEKRNQLGYSLGASLTDFFVPYLTIGAEYTRVNPFVYNNLIPAQTYTSYVFNLGDWMGNNFDRTILYARYNPLPKLQLYGRIQKIRKGGNGSINEQYVMQPQPVFLNNLQYNRTDWLLQVRYEWINNLYINGALQKFQNKNIYQLGISFGL